MPRNDVDLEFDRVEYFLQLDSSKEEALDFLVSLNFLNNISNFLSSDLCTKEYFEYFYDELKDYSLSLTLWQILEHSKCPLEILKRFHLDLDSSIWAFVAKNTNCTKDVLNEIFEKTISKFNQIFEKELYFYECEGILCAIFNNENCSISLMEKFVKMEDEYISKYFNSRMKYFYSHREIIEGRHKVKRDIDYFAKKYVREATKSYNKILNSIIENVKCPQSLIDIIDDSIEVSLDDLYKKLLSSFEAHLCLNLEISKTK